MKEVVDLRLLQDPIQSTLLENATTRNHLTIVYSTINCLLSNDLLINEKELVCQSHCYTVLLYTDYYTTRMTIYENNNSNNSNNSNGSNKDDDDNSNNNNNNFNSNNFPGDQEILG